MRIDVCPVPEITFADRRLTGPATSATANQAVNFSPMSRQFPSRGAVKEKSGFGSDPAPTWQPRSDR
jgi:hypothetical protein